MPEDPTAAARKRRLRARRAGLLPPAVRLACEACGGVHTREGCLLCSRCFERLTVEGRADRAARVARFRARQAAPQ